MRKLLFLFFITISSYGQTYPDAKFGTVTLKNSATVTTTPALTTTEATGLQKKIDPANLPISTATQTALDGKISGAGASGQISFWNGTNTQTGDSSLYWDNINKRLGLGTTSAGVVIDVLGNSFASSQIRSTAVSNTDNSVMAFRRARLGTTAILANDQIGGLGFKGYDGTTYGSDVASISVIAAENFSPSNKGTSLNFQVTPIGATSVINPFNIFGTGTAVNYDFANPTGVAKAFSSLVKGVGDNATYKGVVAGDFKAEDRAGVNSSNKGVLIGLNVGVKPIVARNNIPFDDANGITVNNDGIAKATDALYFSKNSTSFPSSSQWLTLITSDANCDYGIRLMGNHTTEYLNFANKFLVDNNGKLKSGNIEPITNNASVIGTDALNYLAVRSNLLSSNTSLTLDTQNNNSIVFKQGGVEKMRLFNTGNLSIGNTSDTHKLSVTGTANFSSTVTLSGQTASTLAIFDVSKNIVSASTAVYPNLTELTYSKGVTNPIQAQIDSKANLASPIFTGTPEVPIPTTSTGIANKSYVDTAVATADAGNVKLTGNQSFTGTKSGTTSTLDRLIELTNNSTSGASEALRITANSGGIGSKIRTNHVNSTGQWIEQNGGTGLFVISNSVSGSCIQADGSSPTSPNVVVLYRSSGSGVNVIGESSSTGDGVVSEMLGSGLNFVGKNNSGITFTVDKLGQIKSNALAGTGLRLLIADASGNITPATTLPVFADNTAAVAGGLGIGRAYRTVIGLLAIVF